MSAAFEYDDTNLQKLFAELQPKRRKQALKGGARRTAAKVRRVALANLRSSLRSNRQLEKGMRVEVFRRIVGFSVTIRPGKNNIGKYRSSRRRDDSDDRYQPVLLWAELGTKNRYRKGKRSILWRKRGGYTGRMPRLGFMGSTLLQVRGDVTETMHKEIENSIKKTAQKYGCS